MTQQKMYTAYCNISRDKTAYCDDTKVLNDNLWRPKNKLAYCDGRRAENDLLWPQKMKTGHCNVTKDKIAYFDDTRDENKRMRLSAKRLERIVKREEMKKHATYLHW